MEIDPVIFEYRLQADRFNAEMRRTTRTVDEQAGRQAARIRKLEQDMARSSGAIGASIRQLAVTFATAFTGRELLQMADNYTRLQNSLRVAGLEGQSLADVQSRLLQLSQENGVSINGLAELYGRSADAASSFGASQEQLLGLTESTALALRITGTDAQAASGAILGLGQALANGTVRAEEYAQINEGGLRPLLQAAAATDRFKGNINALRNAVYEGEVSSRQFFELIEEGSDTLRDRAADATLTLAGGLQAVSSALTVYIGQADEANGISASLGVALHFLARNLDTIIPALAAIATGLGVGYVRNAVAARVATTSLTTAANAARIALLGAFGGPIGLAITGVALGLGYLASESAKAQQASETLSASIEAQTAQFAELQAQENAAAAAQNELDATQRAALVSTANLTGEAHLLANAWARVAAEAKSAAIEQAQAAFDTARLNRQQADQRLQAAREDAFDSAARRPFAERGLGSDAPASNPQEAIRAASQATRNEQRRANQARRNEQTAEAELERITRGRLATFRPETARPEATGGSTRANSANRDANRAAEERAREEEQRLQTARRATDEEARLEQEAIRARIDLTTDAEERGNLQRDLLDLERAERIRQVQNEADYTDEQREAQLARIRALYGPEASESGDIRVQPPALYERQLERDLADQRARLEQDALRMRADTLRDLASIEDNTAERNRLEQDAMRIEQDLQASLLRQQIANGDIADADEAQAALAQQQAVAREDLRRRQLSPGQAYAENLAVEADNINDALERIQVDALDELNDGLVDAITGAKSLGEVFSNVANQIVKDLVRIAIQQAIIQPLANSLFGGAKGGGLLGSLLGSIGSVPGKAGGGAVSAGTLYRVNEGGVELFRPSVNGTIVPSGAKGGGSGVATVRLQLSGDLDARIEQVSGPVAVEVVRATAPRMIDAAASETTRRLSRPRI